MRLIIVSNNKDKIKDLKYLLNINNVKLDILTLNDIGYDEEIIEFGKTFAQNALIKAQTIAYLYPNDLIIADDSGLCVEALDDAPNIYSSRYANASTNIDQANMDKLLFNLNGILNRKAHFISMLCVIQPNQEPFFVQGKVNGTILHKQIGTNGFGYDQIFSLDGETSFAQLTLIEKNKYSHRQKAFEKLFSLSFWELYV